LNRAKALGAHHLINYVTEPEWGRVARRLTGDHGVDVILEVGGPNTMEQSLKCLGFNGDLCLIGAVAGFEQTRPRVVPLTLFDFLPASKRIHGSMVGSREDQEALGRLCALHSIAPVIDKTFAWTELDAALNAQRAGQHFGKIALTF